MVRNVQTLVERIERLEHEKAYTLIGHTFAFAVLVIAWVVGWSVWDSRRLNRHRLSYDVCPDTPLWHVFWPLAFWRKWEAAHVAWCLNNSSESSHSQRFLIQAVEDERKWIEIVGSPPRWL